MLKYAYRSGCPWDDQTCYSATREQHLDVLCWAINNGCPLDDVTARHVCEFLGLVTQGVEDRSDEVGKALSRAEEVDDNVIPLPYIYGNW